MQPLLILTTLLIIFTAFIVFIVRRVGVLPSISDSFKQLGKYGGLLFWLVLASMAGLMVLLDKQNPYLIISAAGLLFTCGSPYFEIEYPDKPVHFAGAVTAILSAFVNLYVTYGFWQPFALFVVGVGLIALFRIENHTWWVEVWAFYLIIIGMIWGEVLILLKCH
jgi:hypothetical protein